MSLTKMANSRTITTLIILVICLTACSRLFVKVPELPPEAPRGGTLWKEPLLGLEFVYIAGGYFDMGCGLSVDECSQGSDPRHEVYVDGFWMGRYEVTIEQFMRFLDTVKDSDLEERLHISLEGEGVFKKGYFGRTVIHSYSDLKKMNMTNHPVSNVSWFGAKALASWLKRKLGYNFRLPTEAEWEYACRGGHSYFEFGTATGIWSTSNTANYTSEKNIYHNVQSFPVGSFPPNPLGLYDLSGNVWEWCEDWFDESFYTYSPVQNPYNSKEGTYRVIRGGAYDSVKKGLRCSFRNKHWPDFRSRNVGFRLVIAP